MIISFASFTLKMYNYFTFLIKKPPIIPMKHRGYKSNQKQFDFFLQKLHLKHCGCEYT